jgi:hypothetical protein
MRPCFPGVPTFSPRIRCATLRLRVEALPSSLCLCGDKSASSHWLRLCRAGFIGVHLCHQWQKFPGSRLFRAFALSCCRGRFPILDLSVAALPRRVIDSSISAILSCIQNRPDLVCDLSADQCSRTAFPISVSHRCSSVSSVAKIPGFRLFRAFGLSCCRDGFPVPGFLLRLLCAVLITLRSLREAEILHENDFLLRVFAISRPYGFFPLSPCLCVPCGESASLGLRRPPISVPEPHSRSLFPIGVHLCHRWQKFLASVCFVLSAFRVVVMVFPFRAFWLRPPLRSTNNAEVIARSRDFARERLSASRFRDFATVWFSPVLSVPLCYLW